MTGQNETPHQKHLCILKNRPKLISSSNIRRRQNKLMLLSDDSDSDKS